MTMTSRGTAPFFRLSKAPTIPLMAILCLFYASLLKSTALVTASNKQIESIVQDTIKKLTDCRSDINRDIEKSSLQASRDAYARDVLCKNDALELNVPFASISGDPLKKWRDTLISETRDYTILPLLKGAKLKLTCGLRTSNPVDNDVKGTVASILNVAANKTLTTKVERAVVSSIADTIAQNSKDFQETIKRLATKNETEPKQNRKSTVKELYQWFKNKKVCRGLAIPAGVIHHVVDSLTENMLPPIFSVQKMDLAMNAVDTESQMLDMYRTMGLKGTIPIPELAAFFLQPSWAKPLSIYKTILRLAKNILAPVLSTMTPELVALKWQAEAWIKKQEKKVQQKHEEKINATTKRGVAEEIRDSLFRNSKISHAEDLIPEDLMEKLIGTENESGHIWWIKDWGIIALKSLAFSLGTLVSAAAIKSCVKSKLKNICNRIVEHPEELRLILENPGSVNCKILSRQIERYILQSAPKPEKVGLSRFIAIPSLRRSR